MADNIPLFEIAWDREDIKNAVDSIGRGSYWAKGPYVDQFESRLEEFLSVDHAIVVNSGTTALVAALRAHGIGAGDEVIVPSFTFIATANAVRLVGAKPVFADIEPQSYGLEPSSVREKINDRTAGIIPVHLYGGPCRINELVKIAEEKNIAVIEDAAESFGAKFDGEYTGTIGDTGIYSFCQNKIVVTGEGGAIVTDEDDIAEKIRLYRSHGRASGDYFSSVESGEYLELGTNIRMSDLTAAIGCSQINKVDQLIRGRREAAKYMNNRLSKIEGINVPVTHHKGTHVYQLYTIEFEEYVDRKTVIKMLEDNNISSKIYWDTPVHQTHYYQGTTDGSGPEFPITETISDRVLSLPMYPDLTPSQADRIVKITEKAIEVSK